MSPIGISYDELLSDVTVFLKETLASETLSPAANRQRLALLLRLASRPSSTSSGSSPTPYADVNSNGHRKTNGEDLIMAAECYEELESNSEWSGCSSNLSRNYHNSSLYYNSGRHSVSSTHSDDMPRIDPHYENTYMGIDSPRSSSDKGSSQKNSTLNSDQSTSPPPSSKSDEEGHSHISAAMMRHTAAKFGQLLKKEKILFVEHSKKCWVALLGVNLYMYSNEKESKPMNVINVEGYKARPIVTSPTSTKKDFAFELICPGKKTYQFQANVKADMEGWILAINQAVPLVQMTMISSANLIDSHSWSAEHAPNGRMKMVSSKDSLKNEAVTERELPSIPPCEHYDRPNPIIRPVLSVKQPTDFKSANNYHDQETLYHCIDEPDSGLHARYDFPPKKGVLVNAGTEFCESDNVYYNAVPVARCIQNTRNEANTMNSLGSMENKEESEDSRCSIGTGRIQQLIQQMEEISQKCKADAPHNNKKMTPQNRQSKISVSSVPLAVAANEDLYELVNTSNTLRLIDSKV